MKVFPNFNGFIDSYSNLNTPSRHLLKDINGNLIKTISETDKSQFEEYDWSYPSIIQFPSADKSMVLDGIITFPLITKKVSGIPSLSMAMACLGLRLCIIVGGGLGINFLGIKVMVFSLDAKGMSGRGEDFKNLSYGDMSKYLSLDTAAGVKHLIEIMAADPAKIGAWGWSGGGYLQWAHVNKKC